MTTELTVQTTNKMGSVQPLGNTNTQHERETIGYNKTRQKSIGIGVDEKKNEPLERGRFVVMQFSTSEQMPSAYPVGPLLSATPAFLPASNPLSESIPATIHHLSRVNQKT